MNATTRFAGTAHETTTPQGDGALLGLGPLVRKDLVEWRRGRRAWVTAPIVAAVLGLTAANAWINTQVAHSVGSDAAGATPAHPVSMVPLDNLLAAVGTQFVLIAAVFATMSLIVGERESGTLAWTASKPASRLAIWLSKWITASAMLFVVAVLVPVGITTALVTALYGAPDLKIVAFVVIGLQASVMLLAAIALAAGAYARSQGVVVAVGLAAVFLPALVGGLLEPLNDVLPTSIYAWFLSLGVGQAVPLVTPFAWLVSVFLVVAVAARRMNRLEF